MISVSLDAAAVSDLEVASEWYETQRPGLGEEFVLEFDRALEDIRDNPASYQLIYLDYRRVLLHRFPYAVYYLLPEGDAHIMAVLHQRRSDQTVSGKLR